MIVALGCTLICNLAAQGELKEHLFREGLFLHFLDGDGCGLIYSAMFFSSQFFGVYQDVTWVDRTRLGELYKI